VFRGDSRGALCHAIDSTVDDGAGDWLLYPGLAIGAVVSISGAFAILPKHTIVLWNAVQNGDIATARRMHFHIANASKEISKHDWPAGVKLVVNLQGRKCGPCRRPFVSVPPEQEERIRAALKKALAADLSN
jgi:4-hydroxy-tetrahydrodipicolinate synthase